MIIADKLKSLDQNSNLRRWYVNIDGIERDITDQLIAVVEAAEKVASWDDIHAWSGDGEPALPELSNPLDALKEKLS